MHGPIAFLVLLPLVPPPSTAVRRASDGLTPESVRALAARIQDQIEELRGLEFLRPVKVEVTDAAGFVAYARKSLEADGGLERLTSEERAAKLLGLIPWEVDLLALTLDVLTEQVGGFYDPATDTFTILQAVDPTLAEVVIAHEFTHALDDQHHDLDGASRARQDNWDALLAHHALAEGSGMEIMTQWTLEHLAPARLAELGAAQAKMPTTAISQAPPYVWKPLLGIYLQGQAFLRRQERLRIFGGGRAGVEDIERAFREPPRSTEQVLHPEKYWDDARRDPPREVSCSARDLPAGWHLVHQDTLGELLCALVAQPFAERGGMESDAFALLRLSFTSGAAAGWGGDRYGVALQDDGALVLRLYSVWDTPEDAREFAAALEGVAEGIQAAKAGGSDSTAGDSGWHVLTDGDDVVVVTSWRGATEAEALAVAEKLAFAVAPR